MSRSGYSDDCDGWALIRWRGAVKKAICGERGQAFLREMLAAFDAMPVKRLIEHELEKGGEVCAIGTVGAARGMRMDDIDSEDRETVAKRFGIAEALAAEIVFENDQDFDWHADDKKETPERRWSRMRAWVASQIAAPGDKP